MSILPVATIQEVRMPISRERLIELAIARLQNEKARIDSELKELQAELKGGSAGSQKTATRKRTRRKMTAKERKVASERMKKYWAERKKKEAAQKG